MFFLNKINQLSFIMRQAAFTDRQEQTAAYYLGKFQSVHGLDFTDSENIHFVKNLIQQASIFFIFLNSNLFRVLPKTIEFVFQAQISSTGQTVPREPNTLSACQAISCILPNPNVLRRFHKSRLVLLIQSKINPEISSLT